MLLTSLYALVASGRIPTGHHQVALYPWRHSRRLPSARSWQVRTIATAGCTVHELSSPRRTQERSLCSFSCSLGPPNIRASLHNGGVRTYAESSLFGERLCLSWQVQLTPNHSMLAPAALKISAVLLVSRCEAGSEGRRKECLLWSVRIEVIRSDASLVTSIKWGEQLGRLALLLIT